MTPKQVAKEANDALDFYRDKPAMSHSAALDALQAVARLAEAIDQRGRVDDIPVSRKPVLTLPKGKS